MVTPAERTAYAKKVNDWTKRAVNIDKEVASSTLGMVKDLRKDILGSLKSAEGFERKHLISILGEMDSKINAFEANMIDNISSHQDSAWALGSSQVDDALSAVEIGVAMPVLTDVKLLTMRQYKTFPKIRGMNRSAKRRLNKIIRRNVLTGKTVFETEKDIDRKIFRSKSKQGITYRSEKIARTETMRAQSISNDARLMQVKKEVPGMEHRWITARDGRVRSGPRGAVPSRGNHAAAHGQVRNVGEPFDVSGEKLRYPRDPKGSPWNVIECRCIDSPFMKEWE